MEKSGVHTSSRTAARRSQSAAPEHEKQTFNKHADAPAFVLPLSETHINEEMDMGVEMTLTINIFLNVLAQKRVQPATCLS